MKHDIISDLNRESLALLGALDAHPIFARLFDGTISAQDYAAFLAQTYHYVRWTSPLLAAAGERLSRLGQHPDLAVLFAAKATEESGHERLALSDVEALGQDVAVVQTAEPSAAINAYVAWNRYTVEEGSPLAFLGTAYVLEMLAARRAGGAAAQLRARDAIPGIAQATSFLGEHGEVDGPHVAHLTAVLRGLSDPEEQEAIVVSARVTRAIYVGLLPRRGYVCPMAA